MVCTFFGHRDCSYTIKPAIEIKIIELVKNGVNCFYVGTKGNFDYLVINALIETKIRFPEIDINIVLPSIPSELPIWIPKKYTIVPEGIEKAPPKFAIDKCNRWMLDRADYVVGYATRHFGGASKFLNIAERSGKTVINLADTSE